MRMKAVRSLRELSRILNVDWHIRRLCLIKDHERGYPRSVLSRFTKKVGAERLRRIIDEKLIGLLMVSARARRLVYLDGMNSDSNSLEEGDLLFPVHASR